MRHKINLITVVILNNTINLIFIFVKSILRHFMMIRLHLNTNLKRIDTVFVTQFV